MSEQVRPGAKRAPPLELRQAAPDARADRREDLVTIGIAAHHAAEVTQHLRTQCAEHLAGGLLVSTRFGQATDARFQGFSRILRPLRHVLDLR